MNERMKMFMSMYKNQEHVINLQDINTTLNTKVEGDTTVITMYGVIGSWHGDISAKKVGNILDDVDTPNITVRLNSPGGEADQGISIYNRLKDHPAKVKVIVDGMAASAGGIICMAADELEMNTGTLFMMHEALTISFGNKKEMSKTIEVLGKLDESQAAIFMTKTKMTKEEIMVLLENETWFTAEEMEEKGFSSIVKEVEKEKEAPAMNAEKFKESILARFSKTEPHQTNQTKENILSRFKRAE